MCRQTSRPGAAERKSNQRSSDYNVPCTVCGCGANEWKFIPVMLRLTFRGRWWECNFMCVCVLQYFNSQRTPAKTHRCVTCLVSSAVINEIIAGKNMWFSHCHTHMLGRVWVCRMGFIELYTVLVGEYPKASRYTRCVRYAHSIYE